MHVLDNPVWHALTGPQSALGTVTPRSARFDPEVSPFGAVAGSPTDDAWTELAAIVGPTGQVTLTGDTPLPPSGWDVVVRIEGVQMVGDGVAAVIGPEPPGQPPAIGSGPRLEPLAAADVPDMLALVADTRPGPFLPRTVEFGGYLGVRDGTRLVAMAGQRLRPPGYAEVSAVATDPAHRGRGLARQLVLAVADGIIRRGEVPFLHASAGNTGAIRLYESLGFTLRRQVTFVVMVPAGRGRAGRPIIPPVPAG